MSTWTDDPKYYLGRGWASVALSLESDYWQYPTLVNKNLAKKVEAWGKDLGRVIEYTGAPPKWVPMIYSDPNVPRNQAYVFKESDFKIVKRDFNPVFLNPKDYANLQAEMNGVLSNVEDDMQGWFPMIPIYPEKEVEVPVEQPFEHLDTSARLEATRQDGMSCIRCKEVSQYAEPNQEDGTFKCYPCRTYEFRPGLK